jgi:hypothetical protein
MAHLATIRTDVTRLFGPVPVWLTKYGYQTNPPDRLLGVSYARQATYVGEAAYKVWSTPGVTMLIQFLVRDEPELGGWQSGLFTVAGTAKPAAAAFALPLVEVARRGTAVSLWGQVRPGAGAQPYVVQRRVGARWVPLLVARKTEAGQTFRTVVRARAGTVVRVFAPRLGMAGASLRLS